jgi:hypothetical protein
MTSVSDSVRAIFCQDRTEVPRRCFDTKKNIRRIKDEAKTKSGRRTMQERSKEVKRTNKEERRRRRQSRIQRSERRTKQARKKPTREKAEGRRRNIDNRKLKDGKDDKGRTRDEETGKKERVKKESATGHTRAVLHRLPATDTQGEQAHSEWLQSKGELPTDGAIPYDKHLEGKNQAS